MGGNFQIKSERRKKNMQQIFLDTVLTTALCPPTIITHTHINKTELRHLQSLFSDLLSIFPHLYY